MINLLSDIQKSSVRREYRLRLLAVFLVFAAVSIFIALVLLIPSYVTDQGKRAAAEKNYEIFKKTIELQNEKALSSALLGVREKMDSLDGEIDSRARAYEIIERIVDSKGSGVAVSGFSINFSDGKGEIKVEGVADNRASLLAFVQNLKNSGTFQSVFVPVSNYAKESGIIFSLSLTLEKK